MSDQMPRIFTVAEVAERLRFSEWKVKQMLTSGELRGALSGRWRVPEDAITEWLSANSNTPALPVRPRQRRRRRR